RDSRGVFWRGLSPRGAFLNGSARLYFRLVPCANCLWCCCRTLGGVAARTRWATGACLTGMEWPLLFPLLFLHSLPELLGRFAVDRFQRFDGAENLGVTLWLEVAPESLEGHSLQRR